MGEQRKEKIHDYEPLFGAWKVAYRNNSYVCLGRGGFGSVYEVTRESLGIHQRRAVKLIENTDESNIERIKKEVQFMFSLRNEKNIVSIEDFMEVERKHYNGFDVLILMELLTSLETVIKRGKTGMAEVVKLGIHISRALELCEKHKVIHRDIKPANLFINKYGVYKLGDFGIARELEEKTMTTIGTKDYMAPEVIFGRRYDKRADIYSLGLTMYFLLNGNKMPFDLGGSSDLPITKRLDGEQLPALRNVPESLSRVILKACAHKAGDRYGSARELRTALENYKTNKAPVEVATEKQDVPGPADGRYVAKPANNLQTPVRANPVGNAPPLKQTKKKSKKGAVAALCLIAAAIAVGYIYLAKPFDGFLSEHGDGPSEIRADSDVGADYVAETGAGPIETPSAAITEKAGQYENSGLTGLWILADTINLNPEEAMDESTEMEFFPDGTGRLFHEGMDVTQDFTWWLESGQMLLEQMGYISAWDYELSGDTVKFFYDIDTDSYSLYRRYAES